MQQTCFLFVFFSLWKIFVETPHPASPSITSPSQVQRRTFRAAGKNKSELADLIFSLHVKFRTESVLPNKSGI
jgi:hypothetical protein